MKTATVADLRNHFTRIAKWIEEGQPIAITRRGQAFATLSPVRKKKAQTAWPNLAARRVGKKVTPEILDYARGDY